MSITTIPGVLVAPLREGAYAVSRDIAEAIDHGDDLQVCRERLAGVCRLLDVIGWTRADPCTDTEIDVGVHAPILRSAAEIMLPVLRDAEAERAAYEALLEFAATESLDAPKPLEIPAQLVVHLRAVLWIELGGAAADLASECAQAVRDAWAQELARFDGMRALLDAVGWIESEHQQAFEVDIGVHGQMIRGVLESDLQVQRDLIDTDEEGQREQATKMAALIERFLAEIEEAG
jgi:hypothetical protein